VGPTQADHRRAATHRRDHGWRLEPARLQWVEVARTRIRTAYAENIGLAQMQEVARGYSDDGFDLILGHGFEFSSALLDIAPDYPNQHFFVTSYLPVGDHDAELAVICLGKSPELSSHVRETIACTERCSGVLAIERDVGEIGATHKPAKIDAIFGIVFPADFTNPIRTCRHHQV